jgi:hypothetical protein
MSCARALSLSGLQLGELLLQMGRASQVAVLEVTFLPLLWVAGALFREEFARFGGVIAAAGVATALPGASFACTRR